MPDLGPAVSIVIGRCLAVKPGEEVLVVVDRETRSIGEALRDEASRAGSEAVLAIMDPREVNGEEPPPTIAAALKACDVFIAPTSKSLSHTQARKQASEGGARGATMPGVTEDMLARVMAVDFDTMAARSHAVARLLNDADMARLTCPRGSDFTFDLSGREGLPDDGELTARGAFGNLPCGEGFIAPLSGEGRIVVQGTMAGLGAPAEPVTLTVREGRLTEAENDLGPRFFGLLEDAGDGGTNLAELGVGTNDRAKLTGSVLEDEKILGTVHVAFGASAGIGGTVAVPIHLDVVVLEPTLEVGDQRVVDAGRFVLDA
jgi:aminopeptidase